MPVTGTRLFYSGATSMASTSVFDSTVRTLGGLPQGHGASQVDDRTASLCDDLGSTSRAPSSRFRLPGSLRQCVVLVFAVLAAAHHDGASGLRPPCGGCASSPRPLARAGFSCSVPSTMTGTFPSADNAHPNFCITHTYRVVFQTRG